VSRSKKSDLVAELSRHKGVSSASSTKSESSVSTAPPEPEKARPKKVKEEKKEAPKKEAPKKEKKEAPKKEKDEAGEVLSLKRKAKNEAEPPMPRKKAKMAKDE
jgi:hypoxia up-regulated 1